MSVVFTVLVISFTLLSAGSSFGAPHCYSVLFSCLVGNREVNPIWYGVRLIGGVGGLKFD